MLTPKGCSLLNVEIGSRSALLLKCHSSSLRKSAFGLSLVGMILVLTSYYAGHYPGHAVDVPVMPVCPSLAQSEYWWAPPKPTGASLALIESNGFLDDVSDADWRRMKSRFHETPDCHHECEPSPAKVFCLSVCSSVCLSFSLLFSSIPSLSLPLCLSLCLSHCLSLCLSHSVSR